MDESRKKTRGFFNYIFIALVILVFIAPIFRLILMSLKTDGGYGISNYTELFQESRTRKAIVNTIIIALSSTVIATVSGSIFAFIVAYTDVKRKRLLELLILFPFIIPAYIITLSWTGLLVKQGTVNQMLGMLGIGPVNLYSIEGIILVLGICGMPVVYMNVIHMLRKIPRDMEWASRACGYSQWETIFKVDLPQALPAIMAGAVLAFLSSIDNFSVPAFLGISSGIPVLSTYIYEKAISFGPDSFPLAATLSVILSTIAIAGTLAEGAVSRRAKYMESIKEDYSPRILLSDGKRKVLEWVCLVLLFCLNIVPLISMLTGSIQSTYGLKLTRDNITLDNFKFIFQNRGVLQAVRNSIFLAIVTCVVCVIIGTAVAYLKVRKKNKVMALVEKSASLTYAIPGIVLALSMIFHWVEPLPGIRPGLYGTTGILVIAYITRYLILQIKGSATAILAVHPSLEEASRASGRNSLTMWTRILIPLIAGPILSGTFMIFVSALTELTLSSILAAAGTKTIGLTIFNFQQAGDYNLAAAMSAVIVVLVIAGYLILYSGNFEEKSLEDRINDTVNKRSDARLRKYPSSQPN